ncbi:unnamed protein product, partial [Mesorhabditis belari]|uniref:Uncharacterized protein n=1 Tax=Mesorhabditis belari TaxID=2138241 RepID=A0AAF3F0Q8_9BILA
MRFILGFCLLPWLLFIQFRLSSSQYLPSYSSLWSSAAVIAPNPYYYGSSAIPEKFFAPIPVAAPAPQITGFSPPIPSYAPSYFPYPGWTQAVSMPYFSTYNPYSSTYGYYPDSYKKRMLKRE